LGAIPVAGVGFTKLTTRFQGEEILYQRDSIFRVDGKSGLGYNCLRFFAELYSNITDSSEQPQKTSVFNHDARLLLQGFVGYRLNEPKWLNENVDNEGRIVCN
jgi:hypothetical protein